MKGFALGLERKGNSQIACSLMVIQLKVSNDRLALILFSTVIKYASYLYVWTRLGKNN